MEGHAGLQAAPTAELMAALDRWGARQREAAAQFAAEMEVDGARCREEVAALAAQADTELQALREAQAAAPGACQSCLAKDAEIQTLRSQLETALGYRKTCKAQKEQISQLTARVAGLEAKIRFQRAQLLHRGAAAEPSLAARKLAAAEVESESRGQRIEELEAANRELTKHKEVVKAALKKERHAHAALRASLEGAGGQPAGVLREQNARAEQPAEQPAQQPAPACPPPQPAAAVLAGTPRQLRDSGTTFCSDAPEEGGGGDATPQSRRVPSQGAAWQPGSGDAPQPQAPPAAAVEQAETQVASAPGAGGQAAGGEPPAPAERSKRKSDELGPSPVRPAVGRGADGAQRKARKSRLAASGQQQPQPEQQQPARSASPAAEPAAVEPAAVEPASSERPQSAPLAHTAAPARVRGARPGGNGVLETLHILDMRQGAGRGELPRGRLPAIVDAAPASAEPAPAAPAPAEPARPTPGPWQTLRRASAAAAEGPQEARARRAEQAAARAAAGEARVQQRAAEARAKWGGDQPGYKYQDVVRKKADRERLQGFTCPDCEGFYRALQSWGQDIGRPACGHAAAKGGGGAGGGTPIKQMIQNASRHRYKYKPPDTPPGYWDMGFGSDKQEEEQ